MTRAELEAIVDPKGDGAFAHETAIFGRAALTGASEPEVWTYYPTLNLGVLLIDDVVQGLAVTPVKS